jgi:hypothetical protein
MKNKLISIALLVAVVSMVAFAPMTSAQAASSQAVGGLTVPVTGTFTDALGGTGTFTGAFTLTRFVNQGGTLAAVGTLTGTLTDSLGTVLGTITQQVTMPITNLAATCQVLHLELGPLDLSLLGLNVHLNQVVLDITATRGGGLLGDLLCSLAGALNGNTALSGLVQLLNNILRAL